MDTTKLHTFDTKKNTFRPVYMCKGKRSSYRMTCIQKQKRIRKSDCDIEPLVECGQKSPETRTTSTRLTQGVPSRALRSSVTRPPRDKTVVFLRHTGSSSVGGSRDHGIKHFTIRSIWT